jgi:curved DNA-binding protein CbpA
MADYYQILGLSRSADAAQIKAAFKKLAMRYHPDRNPGDKEAEEKFKKINEAYRTLSDPLKKERYDFQFTRVYTTAANRQHEINKRRYYSRSRAAESGYYKIDKEYYRIQGLTLLVFFAIAGFIFAVFQTANFFIEQKNQVQWRVNTQSLKQVNALFESGNQDDALALIRKLKEQDPREYRFSFAHDSLTDKLRVTADGKYDHHEFSSSVADYLLLKKHEDPVRFETIRKISLCQYYLGNFSESLQALKQLHNQQPDNLELVYAIGIINLERLGHATEALHYFNLGKKLFEQNLTQVYGEALCKL